MHTGAGGASRVEDRARFERLARRVGLEDRDVAVIVRVPLFAGLEMNSLADLLAEASVRRFSRNALLFVEGEPAGQFYIVLDGWVRLYRQTADGRESVIALFARGESFAEAVMFLGGAFPVSGAVVDEARLLVIPAEPFRRVRDGRADQRPEGDRGDDGKCEAGSGEKHLPAMATARRLRAASEHVAPISSSCVLVDVPSLSSSAGRGRLHPPKWW